MFCSQCGAENQSEARFCQKCGTALSVETTQATTSVLLKDVESAIWNPNATANWSLIFTPAFGAYLQMLNWRTLGETEKASSSKNWFYVSLGMLVIYVLMGVFMDDSKAADGAARGFGFLFLLIWYFSSGRAQGKYVKEKYGKIYPKKPWGKALLIGVGAIVGYFIAAVVVGFVLGLADQATKTQPIAQVQPAQHQLSSPIISAETRYHDNGNGTVTDLKTDLQWVRCSLGQELKDNTCSGVANIYKWEAAKNELIMLKNKSDWRIPSVEELRTLVYCSSGHPMIWNNTGDKCQGKYNSPTIDSVIFPNTPAWAFWSSSNSVYGSSHAWIVHFGKGEADTYDKEMGGIHLRLVRGGK